MDQSRKYGVHHAFVDSTRFTSALLFRLPAICCSSDFTCQAGLRHVCSLGSRLACSLSFDILPPQYLDIRLLAEPKSAFYLASFSKSLAQDEPPSRALDVRLRTH